MPRSKGRQTATGPGQITEIPCDPTSDIKALVKSYNSFYRDCTRSRPRPGPVMHDTAYKYGQRHGLNHPPPPLVDLYFGLPRLPLHELTDPDWNCPICLEDTRNRRLTRSTTACVPVRLECSHIFGDKCLLKWLLPVGTPKDVSSALQKEAPAGVILQSFV